MSQITVFRHFVVAAALHVCAIAAANPVHELSDSITLAGGARYEVKLSQRVRADLEAKPAFGFWGAGMPSPVVCVSSMTVALGKQTILIPAKLYTDLCSINRLWFVERQKAVTLVLEGGDASESFRSEYSFTGWRLTQRTVRHGFSEKVIERTQLSRPEVLK